MIDFTIVKARFESLKRGLNDQGELFDAPELLHLGTTNPWVRYPLVMDDFGAMIQ